IDINEQFNFFNPKFGLMYSLTNSTDVYASYAIANREPVRNDFVDAPEGSSPKAETLRNLEAGIRRNAHNFSYTANFYYMNYKNQLVLTGELNDVGSPVRTNVDKSYRAGIELSGGYRFSEIFK